MIRSNAIQDIIMVDRQTDRFCKPKNDSFGRGIVYRQVKSVSKVSIPVRTKQFLFHVRSSPT